MPTFRPFAATLLGCALAALSPLSAGCGGSSSPHQGPSPDAGPGQPIGGACASGAGGACAQGEECDTSISSGEENLSASQIPLPNGYCTASCLGTCPGGSTCISGVLSGIGACAQTCTRDSDCRQSEGYVCLNINAFGGVCMIPFAGTNQGAACVAPPATLPSAGFTTPNVLVPQQPADLFDAEGNVDVDGQGHAAVSFIAVQDTGSNEGVAVYTDPSVGGAGFGLTLPQEFATTYAPGFTSDPVVAFDRAVSPPRLHMTWIDIAGQSGGGTQKDAKIMETFNDAGGAPGKFSPPMAVSPPASGALLDKPWVVARSGTVVVTYLRANQSVTPATLQINVVRSTDGGQTWSAPISPNPANVPVSNFAQPVLDAAGDLWVSFLGFTTTATEIVVAEQPAGASSFTRTAVASGSIEPGIDGPSLAVSSDGRTMWVVFSDGDPAIGANVWAAESTDLGASFGAPIQVNDDASPKAPMTCATHYHPAVAIDGLGRPHVAWYDNRWLEGTVMWAYSSDGRTFSANAVVNDATFPFTTYRESTTWLGDYLGISVDGSNVYVAWADPRSFHLSRMYFAERPLPP